MRGKTYQRLGLEDLCAGDLGLRHLVWSRRTGGAICVIDGEGEIE